MGVVIETFVAKLGSRLSLHFQPRSRTLKGGPLGWGYDLPLELTLGICVDGESRVLPTVSEGELWETLEQEQSLTAIRFKARGGLPVRAEWTFTAPFYPGDKKLSTAPFIYIDAVVTNPTDQPVEGEVVLALPIPDDARAFSLPDGFGFRRPWRGGDEWLKTHLGDEWKNHFSAGEFPGSLGFVSLSGGAAEFDSSLRVPFRLEPGESAEFRFAMAGYIDVPVLQVRGEPSRFTYVDTFDSLDAVLRYAADEREAAIRRSALFESTIRESSFGKSARDLIAYAFQSFVANSFWTRLPDGRQWFSVWEGSCTFHSTIDVEYNCAPFYLLYWPELLEMLLDQWPHYRGDGWLLHDMGNLLEANGARYGAEMELEENANYLLMLYALWVWGGRADVMERHYPQAVELANYILESDTDGDGFPDRGAANTIDDASPAVQTAKAQSYLAVKCFCALTAVAEMADAQDDGATHSRCRRFMASLKRALDEKAWLGDHYAVCLDSLPGADAYSIYTANGLLYPLLCGTPVDLDLGRLKTDLISATREALIDYGCTHTSADRSNLWISQNLWRDAVAAYLGIDQLDLAERYWSFELFENLQGRGGCFCDTYGWNHLHYYPRGIASVAMLPAVAGLRINRVAGKIYARPVRAPLRVPLLPFADWANEKIPWLEITLENGRFSAMITEMDLIQGLELG